MAAKPRKETPVEKMTYEDAVSELEAIIERIEEGQIGLEESLESYRRGAALIQRCRSLIDVAEQQVKKVTVAALSEEARKGSGRGNSAND
jgi:exodeoxyribonuclease VII small subunit